MAVTQKMSETGWFYHAPARPNRDMDRSSIPPASQIPGLSDLAIDPNEVLYQPTRNVIKESDSKYIKMAKKGGRQDLLRFKDFKPKSDEPATYPRNEWFYLEDNRAEAEAESKNGHWDFRLPEYMVHEAYKPDPNAEPPAKPSRYPYARGDNTTVYQREGESATDKTVRIPELRKTGFGYRQERQMGKPVKMNTQPKEKPIIPKGQTENKPRYLPMPTLDCELEKPQMGKILSYNYASEWHSDVKSWQQKNNVQNKTQKPTRTEPLTTEYQENINKTGAGLAVKSKPSRREVKIQEPTKKPTQTESTQKDLFKLSRFNKVHSKVNSHRTHEGGMPAVHS